MPADPSPVRDPGPAAALRDATADDDLDQKGYAALAEPLVDPDRAAGLRERFGELHGWEGDGFANDFQHADPGYRREAQDLLLEALGPLARDHFVGHEPFHAMFSCKWPGASSDLPPHQDWTCVDERTGQRTFAVFIALDDIHQDNGQVSLVPGSHRIDPSFRGTDLISPWLSHDDVLRRRATPVPLPVGTSVVWDSRTVHTSGVNRTEAIRVACTVWMRSAGVGLVHARRRDDATATLHPVEPSFFVTVGHDDLDAAPPGSAIDVLEVEPRVLTASALDAELATVAHRPAEPGS